MGKMALAELPQASKWGKWRLRNFRKRQNGENGLCGTSASIKMEEMALAGLPQASKREKWPLRNFRKHQNGENGLCGTSASVKMEKMAFAGLPQAFPKVICPFGCSIFGHSMGMHKKAGPAMSNRKPCFVYQRKTDAPGEQCAVFMSSIPRSQPSAHPPERSRLP